MEIQVTFSQGVRLTLLARRATLLAIDIFPITEKIFSVEGEKRGEEKKRKEGVGGQKKKQKKRRDFNLQIYFFLHTRF